MDVKDIVQLVFRELPHGRVASWESLAIYMMNMVKRDGDHLEIGMMHGGTLIMSALVKKEFGLSGRVVGVDPLDGYYPAGPLHPNGVHSSSGGLLTRKVDTASGAEITREVLNKNMDYFGVKDRIDIVQAFSYPWPDELKNSTFTTAYIDGDHYGAGPLMDWNNVHPRILPGGVVWFDDCNPNCPGVQAACEEARRTDGWEFVEHHQKHTFVMRKNG